MEGKTDEARADLARLALIRKQREEAAKKREEERKGNLLSEKQNEGGMRKGIFGILRTTYNQIRQQNHIQY